ncbi:hypothetical protein MTR_8g467120 [Medicago truncatula]|uniref:Uncharacterized protein n=1 Tax=Medicago truncatula TaxID=3880 RepID=A0A072TQM7_MEDTR|nr:hypothetical protein MTR_8g467120 [Medicago truncatula]
MGVCTCRHSDTQEEIYDGLNLGAKERGLELIRAKIRRFGHKNMSPPSHKLGTARANIGTAVPSPRTAVCCFCLDFKLLYFSFTKKPAFSCGTF